MSPRIGRILLHPLPININSQQPELRILRIQRSSPRSSDIRGLCGSRTSRVIIPSILVVAVSRREESGEDAAD
jgi:hypothetical protein